MNRQHITGLELITEDQQVEAMAKRAGCWAPLRQAQRDGRSVAVLDGLTLYGAFHDGLIAVACSTPTQVVDVLAKLQPAMGFQFVGVHPSGEIH
ncbi:hypothetical protein SAMN02949497_3244 [Methylomagnum ishizawai]|uniref:Uncharacterized protein n=1 Tax=Methylomagnum ishizawai TaxID=1760988 RepID=A0A1Y6CYX2_9GAMM|nr:hypothetical protein [Methylomagnum ishizawai]SMF95868.1 hypothetical protein SAMN02949497_3244 [Methylomagnum ishizawai]